MTLSRAGQWDEREGSSTRAIPGTDEEDKNWILQLRGQGNSGKERQIERAC